MSTPACSHDVCYFSLAPPIQQQAIQPYILPAGLVSQVFAGRGYHLPSNIWQATFTDKAKVKDDMEQSGTGDGHE